MRRNKLISYFDHLYVVYAFVIKWITTWRKTKTRK